MKMLTSPSGLYWNIRARVITLSTSPSSRLAPRHQVLTQYSGLCWCVRAGPHNKLPCVLLFSSFHRGTTTHVYQGARQLCFSEQKRPPPPSPPATT